MKRLLIGFFLLVNLACRAGDPRLEQRLASLEGLMRTLVVHDPVAEVAWGDSQHQTLGGNVEDLQRRLTVLEFTILLRLNRLEQNLPSLQRLIVGLQAQLARVQARQQRDHDRVTALDARISDLEDEHDGTPSEDNGSMLVHEILNPFHLTIPMQPNHDYGLPPRNMRREERTVVYFENPHYQPFDEENYRTSRQQGSTDQHRLTYSARGEIQYTG